MPRLIGIGTLRPWRGEPVAEQLGRLVGALQGARRPPSGRAAPPAATYSAAITTAAERMSIVSRRYCARPTLPASTSAPAMNAGFDAVTSCTSVDEAGVALVGALVERVLADHVGGGEQEQLRLRRRARTPRRPRGCACARAWCAIGAVRLVRSGRRLVPENFGMTPSSLCVLVWLCDGSGQGTGRTSGAESNGSARRRSHANEGSPSFAADRSGEIGLRTRAAEDTVQCSAH